MLLSMRNQASPIHSKCLTGNCKTLIVRNFYYISSRVKLHGTLGCFSEQGVEDARNHGRTESRGPFLADHGRKRLCLEIPRDGGVYKEWDGEEVRT